MFEYIKVNYIQMMVKIDDSAYQSRGEYKMLIGNIVLITKSSFFMRFIFLVSIKSSFIWDKIFFDQQIRTLYSGFHSKFTMEVVSFHCKFTMSTSFLECNVYPGCQINS